jgi:hypothetical protein
MYINEEQNKERRQELKIIHDLVRHEIWIILVSRHVEKFLANSTNSLMPILPIQGWEEFSNMANRPEMFAHPSPRANRCVEVTTRIVGKEPVASVSKHSSYSGLLRTLSLHTN